MVYLSDTFPLKAGVTMWYMVKGLCLGVVGAYKGQGFFPGGHRHINNEKVSV